MHATDFLWFYIGYSMRSGGFKCRVMHQGNNFNMETCTNRFLLFVEVLLVIIFHNFFPPPSMSILFLFG